MNYTEYRRAYFTDPPPMPAFALGGIFGVSLFVQPYAEAVAYYSRVLGEPAYVEGDNTRGWRIGESWLTLLRTREGNPSNVEITLLVNSIAEADRLRQAFVDAGGTSEGPFDDLMYEPFSISAVTDPFGTSYTIVARLGGGG